MTLKTVKGLPFITVILTAYNRRNFLLGAIKSALDQTLPRDRYELIVIKNFADKKIDGFCKRKGVFEILTRKHMTLGEYFHLGITRSRGEVVCFLEDDDLFNRNKLKVMYDEFMGDSDLVFYHNAYDIINSEGKIFPGLGPKKPIKVKTDADRRRRLPELLSVDAAGNTSAMALRKALLGRGIDGLLDKEIKNTIDSFLFFLSVGTHRTVMMDSRVLSYYRKHSEGGGIAAVLGRKVITLKECRAKSPKWCATMIEDFEKVERRVHDPICNRCLAFLIVCTKLNPYLYGKGEDPKLSISDYVLYLNYSLRSEHKLNYALWLLMHFAVKIAPETTISFYYNYSMRKFASPDSGNSKGNSG